MQKKLHPQINLTIHLFDHKIQTLAHATALIDKSAADQPKPLQLGGIKASLFTPHPSENPPPWATVISPYYPEIKRLRNQTHSALILLPVDQHVFALTFGRAKHLLPSERLVRNFGLRTVINAVRPDALRSLDIKSFEAFATHRRVQTSIESKLPRFGIDWTHDLLRAVTGTPEDREFTKRISGADALVLCGHHCLADAPKLCQRALKYYKDKRYQETDFKSIDFLQPEHDSEILENLDTLLRDAILDPKETAPPHFAIDDILDYETVTSYQLKLRGRATGTEVTCLDIAKLRAFLKQHEKAPRDVAVTISMADTTPHSYNAYDSLEWSTSYKNQPYRFTSGIWLRIEQGYAKRLAECIAAIQEPTMPLPAAPHDVMVVMKGKPNHERGEGLFIQEVTKDPKNFITIHPGSFRSSQMNEAVEPCDVLSPKGQLYYIKRKAKSAGLSHLFNQGRTAAITLHDAEYRTLFTKHIETVIRGTALSVSEQDRLIRDYCKPFPKRDFLSSKLEICFVVIRKSVMDLPYLSQVALYEAYQHLTVRDFDVRLQCVTPAAAPSSLSTKPIRRSSGKTIEPPNASQKPSMKKKI